MHIRIQKVEARCSTTASMLSRKLNSKPPSLSCTGASPDERNAVSSVVSSGPAHSQSATRPDQQRRGVRPRLLHEGCTRRMRACCGRRERTAYSRSGFGRAMRELVFTSTAVRRADVVL